jgi:uncharacterized protein
VHVVNVHRLSRHQDPAFRSSITAAVAGLIIRAGIMKTAVRDRPRVRHNAPMFTESGADRIPRQRARGSGWVAITAAGAVLWAFLVAAGPPGFFGLATVFGVVWLGVSALAAPPGLSIRLRPTVLDVVLGVASGLVLYGFSHAFLRATCGGFTDALCGPVDALFARFDTRAPLSAVALFFILAPAEELFWRGVVQARVSMRFGAVRAVVVATAIPVVLALATGQQLLALAIIPTYAVWGTLTAWRGTLIAALVSHALWTTLIAVTSHL